MLKDEIVYKLTVQDVIDIMEMDGEEIELELTPEFLEKLKLGLWYRINRYNSITLAVNFARDSIKANKGE
jgi:hypothetical protein